MTNNPKFTIELLEKIGNPLTVAINNVLPDNENSEVDAAQIMAQLLGCTTQMSTSLYNTLEIKEGEDQADSTRLALAALVAPLVAEFYASRKQIPAEENITRIGKSLESVISFGENFSPATDHQSRLQTIDHDVVFFDKEQPALVVLQAMVPVINAVEEFSFGQSRRKLVQSIVAKLERGAAQITKKIGNADKLKELIIFKALADIYASCHRAATQRASSASDRGEEMSLDLVWEDFETRVAMIGILMGYEAQSEGDTQESKMPSPVQVADTTEKPQSETPSSSGPMGFFKKDENNEDRVKSASEEGAEKTETPKAPPPVTENKEDGSNAAPTNPMGFFKPGAKKEDSDEA